MNLTVSPAGEPREVDPGAISCTAIELRWSEPWANVTDSATRPTVTGYRIEAKQRAVDADWQVLVENTGAPSNRIYTHRDLPPRSGWEYRLAAITPNGMGAWSPPLARVAAVRTSRTLEVSSILDLTVQSLYSGSIIHEVEWFRSPDRARPAWTRVTGASDRLYEVTTADIGQIFRVSVIHTELFSPLGENNSPPRPESRDVEALLATYYDPVGADDSPVFSESAAEHAVNAGTSLNILLPEATGGSGAVSYELSPALPSALRFNAETRTITGTAPGGLSYTGTLTARDPDCDEDSVAV